LVEAHADVRAADDAGITPLHLAASNGFVRIVEILLVARADVHAKGLWNFTPRDYAVLKRHDEIAEMLLAAENADDGS
jgi:ankyrin repeat protein